MCFLVNQQDVLVDWTSACQREARGTGLASARGRARGGNAELGSRAAWPAVPVRLCMDASRAAGDRDGHSYASTWPSHGALTYS